jgi:hypothetical protein
LRARRNKARVQRNRKGHPNNRRRMIALKETIIEMLRDSGTERS